MVDFLFNPLISLLNASSANGNETPLGKEVRNGVSKSQFMGTELKSGCNHANHNSARSSTESTSSVSIAGGRNSKSRNYSSERRRIFTDYWSNSAVMAPLYLSSTQYPISLTTRQVLPSIFSTPVSFNREAEPSSDHDDKAKSYQSLTNGCRSLDGCHTVLSCPDLNELDKPSEASVNETFYIDSGISQKCDEGMVRDRCNSEDVTKQHGMQRQTSHPYVTSIRRANSMEKLHTIQPKPELNKLNSTQPCEPASNGIAQEFRFHDAILSPSIPYSLQKQTSNSSFSSTVSEPCPSYLGGTENIKPVSILRKPRCHSRHTSLEKCNGINGISAKLGSIAPKSGDSSKDGGQLSGVPRCNKNIVKSVLRRPPTPTSTFDNGRTSPKPPPHVSLFKRPDSVRLPWRIGDAELPSWFTKPFYQHKNSLSFSSNSNDDSRQNFSLSGGGRSTSYGYVEDHRWTSHVQFDPRIGVVEYIEDDDHVAEYTENKDTFVDPRYRLFSEKSEEENSSSSSKWFSAEELNQFKLEALQQAQLMLLSLPKSRLSSHLCTANQLQQRRGTHKGGAASGQRVRPSRGRTFPAPMESPIVPRRASFANPILHYTPEDILIMEGSEELASLLRTHIRSVLVVDPSEDLRALFQKYFSYLFPKTKVLTTANAEGALKLIEAAKLMEINTSLYDEENDVPFKVSCNGFDIIIVEENLKHKGKAENRYVDYDYESIDEMNADDEQAEGSDKVHTRHSSSGSSFTDTLAMSGSELINLMTKAEKTLLHLKSQQDDACFDRTISSRFRPSLYIGVSLFLSEDGPKFLKSGADLIWGKPPPKIDDNVRNHLVTTLLKKRGDSVLICSP